jgi:hypothetical protein
MVAGVAQETEIRRTSEAFIRPNAALGAGLGLCSSRWSVKIAFLHDPNSHDM